MALGIALLVPVMVVGKWLGLRGDAIRGPVLAILIASTLLHAHYLCEIPDKDSAEH